MDWKNDINDIYKVGGSVRDELLHKKSFDIDYVVTGISPEKLENIMENHGEYKQVGKSFPVYKYKPIYNDHKYEEVDIAIARRETSTGKYHNDFEYYYTNNILFDLARRDFTINAIAINVHTDELIDPFNGLDDIMNKIIRVVNKKAFIEDPMRVLRMCRFACVYDFNIDKYTYELAKKSITSLKYVSKYRIRKEIDKLFKSTSKPSKFFTILKDLGGLEAIHPEFKSIYSSFKEITLAMDKEYIKNIDMKIYLLIYKIKRFKEVLDRIGYIDIKNIIYDLNKIVNNKEKILTNKNITGIIQNINNNDNTKYVKDILYKTVLIRKALGVINKETLNKQIELINNTILYYKNKPWNIRHLDISGYDIMNIYNKGPGKWIKDIKEKIMKIINDNKIKNNNKQIKEYLQNL